MPLQDVNSRIMRRGSDEFSGPFDKHEHCDSMIKNMQMVREYYGESPVEDVYCIRVVGWVYLYRNRSETFVFQMSLFLILPPDFNCISWMHNILSC